MVSTEYLAGLFYFSDKGSNVYMFGFNFTRPFCFSC